jgi:Glycosyl hydrolases family 39
MARMKFFGSQSRRGEAQVQSKQIRVHRWTQILVPTLVLLCSVVVAQTVTPTGPPLVVVNWAKKTPNRTTPTLQAVVNPMLRRGSPIHDASMSALRRLGCDYVRYAFWFPYPKLSVAELKPPDQNQTYWDFQYMDPLVDDFYNASQGHPVVWSFSTIPQWMFTTPQPVVYPDDPNQVMWNYTQGTELKDVNAMANYYARLASWYTQGGFTDELGKYHSSGHHYDMGYWEVFNEIDGEHEPTPQQYVERYDAIAEAVSKVVPQMKFVGLALSWPSGMPSMFEYFLDPKNHKPGVPLDYISFHVYAAPGADQTPEDWQYTFMDRASEFLAVTRYILRTRDRLSPSTKILINEAGSILSGDMVQGEPNHVEQPILPSYWNLSGSFYAYLYVELGKLGVDAVGESQLVGFPSQFPSVSMIDWTNGKPNARYTILELLKNNLGPGDDFAETELKNGTNADMDAIEAQGYLRNSRPGGQGSNPGSGQANGQGSSQRKLLLINPRNREIAVELPKECAGASMQTIGGSSPDVVRQNLVDMKVRLQPYSVSIVTLKD